MVFPLFPNPYKGEPKFQDFIVALIIIGLVAFLLISIAYEKYKYSDKKLKKKLKPESYISWARKLKGVGVGWHLYLLPTHSMPSKGVGLSWFFHFYSLFQHQNSCQVKLFE